MRYRNSADVLPEELICELLKYVEGELLYIPQREPRKAWGMNSGSRQYYSKRNEEIVSLYQSGKGIQQLSEAYNLSYDTIRKIVKR